MHTQTNKYKPIQCPRCNSTIMPIVTDNCESIVHPADKKLKAMGKPVSPHVDVDYHCPCGFHRHITLTCDWREVSSADVFARAWLR